MICANIIVQFDTADASRLTMGVMEHANE